MKQPLIRGVAKVLFGAATTLIACQERPSPPSATTKEPSASAPGQSAAALSPTAEPLDQLDPRQPVPLLPMMAWHQKQSMMDHLEAIRGVVTALAQEDHDAVRQAARALEAGEGTRRQCEHMGAGAPGFTELALEFHERAAEIGAAAASEDTRAVLAATSNTLHACTTCHSRYRQQVVSTAAWMERTGSHAPPAHPPEH